MRNFVEHDRALLRRFETSGLAFNRSRKRATLVPKEFGFEQIARKRRAVDLYEWLRCPPRLRSE